MKKVIYMADRFGFVGSECYNANDENVMMKCITINALQAGIMIGESVSFRIIDI